MRFTVSERKLKKMNNEILRDKVYSGKHWFAPNIELPIYAGLANMALKRAKGVGRSCSNFNVLQGY